MMSTTSTLPVSLVVGQRVSTNLYSRGMGTVFAIHGEQQPETMRSMLGGAGRCGGRAEFDIVFDCGSFSMRLPETILHGVQWKIHDEVASAEQIAAAVAFAEQEQAERSRKAAEANTAHAAEVARLKQAPEFAHLANTDNAGGASVAGNIRKQLKKAFPGVKFSVTSPRGSIQVRWTDGPTGQAVHAIVDRYENGHFDGMDDCYKRVRSAWVDAFGGVDYVFANRNLSDALIEHAIAVAFERHACDLQGIQTPTAGDYSNGRLWSVRVTCSLSGVLDLQTLIRRIAFATVAVGDGFQTPQDVP